MSLPLLEYRPTTQNQRVADFGYVDTNGEVSYSYQLKDGISTSEVEDLIWAAYRQVFNEQETLKFNRQIALETQLKNRAITVRDFIRGLAKSDRFYSLVVEPNNNYRLVELCLKRLLGRTPYNQEEEIAWSVQIGTLGWHGFVDALLDSEEYTQAFGNDTVPYQRRRMTERPFSFTPRYGEDYRDRLPQPTPSQFAPFQWEKFLRQSDWATVSGLLVGLAGFIGVFLALTTFLNNTGS